MIKQMYPLGQVEIKTHFGTNSSILSTKYSEASFDMGFIDASHVHPWTTLDAIATLPCLESGGRVHFHDVNLHRLGTHKNSRNAIGVKHLFDQFPDNVKHISNDESNKNIGYVDIPSEGYLILKDAIMDSLFIPWTLNYRLGHSVILDYANLAKKYWGEKVALALLDTSNKYNPEQKYRFSLLDLD